MKVDYSKGKIYKITNDYNDDIYVGSTCDSLVKRFSSHKQNSKTDFKNNKLFELIKEIGFERFRIQLICNYPCEDKYQLRQKEGEYIRLLGTLNIKIEGRTQKEYFEDNKDKMKKYWKEYREENKNKIYEQRKQYREENNEKITKCKKESYNKNKEKVNEKINCDCGCLIMKRSLARHEKSPKHINLMNHKTTETN